MKQEVSFPQNLVLSFLHFYVVSRSNLCGFLLSVCGFLGDAITNAILVLHLSYEGNLFFVFLEGENRYGCGVVVF